MGLVNRADLRALALLRLNEAKALRDASFPCGAYYLAGFAVECALKACIASQTNQDDFPDKKRALDAWEHSPDKLVKAAGLLADLEQERQSDVGFRNNWRLVTAWGVEQRYEIGIQMPAAQALIDAIDEPNHGVFRWLQKHW